LKIEEEEGESEEDSTKINKSYLIVKMKREGNRGQTPGDKLIGGTLGAQTRTKGSGVAEN
jgi:hypothetical protein